MGSAVLDSATAAALDHLAAAVDEILDAGVEPFDSGDAKVLVGELEVQCRRLRSSQVDLLGAIAKRSLHRPDGHGSAKIMVRHDANISSAEAERRSKSSTALADLPVVHAAFRAGRIGGCQVERIAAAHANPRVRAAVIANEAAFAAQAQAVGYRLFHLMVTNWVNEVDQDGPRDRNQRCHDNRDFKLVADFDGTWVFNGGCASMQGTQMAEILKHFYEAETLADWEEARAEHGDAATATDLARTDSQRRSDACLEIFRRAAADHASTGGSPIVTNIVIDHATFERLVALFFGVTPDPEPDPTLPSSVNRSCRPSGTHSTATGAPHWTANPSTPPKPSHPPSTGTSGGPSSAPTASSSTSGDAAACSAAPPPSPSASPTPPATGRAATSPSPTAKSTTSAPGPNTAEEPTPETGDPHAGDTTDSKNTATPPDAMNSVTGTSPAPTAPKSTDPPTAPRIGPTLAGWPKPPASTFVSCLPGWTWPRTTSVAQADGQLRLPHR